MFGIAEDSGKSGLDLYGSAGFDVRLRNEFDMESAIHWQGLTPPIAFDGTELAQALVMAGGVHT